jgi:RHS repeat-associated protein
MIRTALVLCFALGGGVLLAQQGALTGAGCGSITGWSQTNNGAFDPVDIYDGAVYLASVTIPESSSYPTDFLMVTPANVMDNQIHSIYVYFGGTTTPLPGSPISIQCTPGSTGYQYGFTDTFQNINTNNWTKNGTVMPTTGGIYGGGSLIAIANSTTTIQSNDNYEVRMTISVPLIGGTNDTGSYTAYLRASSAAPSAGSTYVAVTISQPDFTWAQNPNGTWYNTGVCTASLTVSQLATPNGQISQLLNAPITCSGVMQVRAAAVNSNAYIMVNGVVYTVPVALASGLPGVGTSDQYHMITEVQFGPWDDVAPSAVNSGTITTDVYPTNVTMAWQGAVDNPNGVGVAYYYIARTGFSYSCGASLQWSTYSYDASFYDASVQPKSVYTYCITAYDFHGNASPPTLTLVSTPPAGSIDPRRVGVQRTGSYWGGAGEQVDLVSGNLNFSLPLVTAMGRAGLKATFGLSYNSQNWVVGAIPRLLGADTGYGFGWQLMLGSLLPVWGENAGVGGDALAYYLYTDSTGAQYRLDQYNQATQVWSSLDSIYVSYDSSSNRLYFRNGIFWLMGCTSAGGEQDAGTMYPTVVEDTNGNQIIVTYMQGAGAYGYNSSSRIYGIQDARPSNQSNNGEWTTYSYLFTYTTANASGMTYLTAINSFVGTLENYAFTIQPPETLYAPNGTAYTTASMLASVTATGPSVEPALGYSWNFSYEQPSGSTSSLGDGSLTEVQFPQGGFLGWSYLNWTYITSRTMEEVSARYLQSAAGATQGTESTYAFTRPSGDQNNGTITVHSGMILQDPQGAQEIWSFNPTGSFNVGLISERQEWSAGGTWPTRDRLYGWQQDSVGNAYVSSVQTTLDKGQAYAQSTTTAQTLDTYGNATNTTVTDYNGQTRTYQNTYAYTQSSYSQYSAYYLYDRLLTSTLTSTVGPNVTLVSNTYDGSVLQSPRGGVPAEWDLSYSPTSVNVRGNLTQTVTPGHTINTGYDTTGTAIEQDDNYGHSVSVTTSAATNFTLPDTLNPNSTGQLVTQALYNPLNLAPASVAGPAQTPYTVGSTGTAAYTDYDKYGRVDYTLAPSQIANSASGAKTSYNYSYALPWAITASTPNTGGNNHWAATTLDGLGRPVIAQDGYGTGGSSMPVSEVDTAYAPSSCAPLGRMSQQSLPYQPGQSAPETKYYYDGSGRTTSIVQADGSTTQYTYQGNSTTVVDPTGRWKQYANDAFGNLITVIEPDPAASAMPLPVAPSAYPMTLAALPPNTVLTIYGYDALNHLLSVSMPRSVGGTMQTQARTFSYDTSQRLQCSTNPENGTVNYAYNADSTLATKWYGACGSIAGKTGLNMETYGYDTYQRLSKIHRFPGGVNEDLTQLQTFAYVTQSGNANNGMLASATFASNVGPNELTLQNQYTYTPAGKMLTKTLYLTSTKYESGGNPAPGSVGVNYAYDNQGVLTNVTPSLAPTLTYGLDSMERPNGLTDSSGHTWVSDVTYNAANQLLGANFPSGTESWLYNTVLQLTQRTTIPASGPALLNMTYNYAPGADNGQMTKSVDSITGETVTYTYDWLKRLVQAASTTNGTETYTYDEFGNLTGMGGPSGTLNAGGTNVWQTNQIVPSGVGYDSYGNVTTVPAPISLTLGYDVANRPVLVNGSQAYAYDEGNRRVYYHGTSEYIYLYGANGKKLATYTIGQITNTAIPLSLASENLYFGGKLINAEGNAVATDGLGSVRWSGLNGGTAHRYYPYGVEYNATTNNTEKYATYTRDTLTGLDYAMNRYYSSIWGRFLSPDPSWRSADPRTPQSWNRYTYALDDPANGMDPTGLDLGDDGSDGSDYCDVNMCIDGGGGGGGGGGGDAAAVTSTFQVFCADGYVPDGNGGCDVALGQDAQIVGALINQMDPEGFINTTGTVMGATYGVAFVGAELVAALGVGTTATVGTAAVGAAESPVGQQLLGPVVNIGGEGEVSGAINFQGPWIFDPTNYAASATGQTLAEMQAAGNQFVVGSNSALPFAPGSVGTVITNGVPIGEGMSNWLGPLVQPSQIWQVLSPGVGQWINNGVVVPHP